MNKVLQSFFHAVVVLGYVALVAWIMATLPERFADKVPNILGIIGFLMLFVLSAAVVGSLVFGKPALMYFGGEKQEALKFLFFTVAWLVVLTAAVLLFLAL